MAEREGVAIKTYDILLREPCSYSQKKKTVALRVHVSAFLQFYIPGLFSLIKKIIYSIKRDGRRYEEITSGYDAVIVGGGNIIMDKMGSDYICRVDSICRQSKSPVYIYAAGAGPINNEKAAKRIKEHASFVSVRDSGSQFLMGKDGVHLNYDPAFVISDITSIERKGGVLGVNVISGCFSRNDLECLAADVASYASENKFSVRIIVTAYPNDLIESEALAANIAALNDRLFVEIMKTTPDIESISKAYADLDFFVGCRMHSLIFSLSHAVPSIGYEWDPKVQGMFKMFFGDFYATSMLYRPGGGISNKPFLGIDIESHASRVKKEVYSQFGQLIKLIKENEK